MKKGMATIAALAALLYALPAAAAPLEREADFPGGSFRSSSPESQGMDSGRLERMLRFLSEGRYGIHGMVVIRNGRKVLDASFYPFRNGLKHAVNSCTKSVTSALVGIAIEKGKLPGSDAKALGYFHRRFRNMSENKREIRVADLLSMSSGLDWSETGPYDAVNSYVQMLASEDPIGFVLDKPALSKPGGTFVYSSGNSHLLSAILRTAASADEAVFAEAELFRPLGISDWHWSKDRKGLSLGGGGLYLRLEDMAKFGYLYLRKGRWRGLQVVPEGWVESSTKRRVATPSDGGYGYGYGWWMNGSGGYSAIGHKGQYIVVVPSLDLVVAVTSGIAGSEFAVQETIVASFIVPAIKSDSPLPENEAARKKLEATAARLSGPAAPEKPRPLPAIARAISGRTFSVRDIGDLSFDFEDPDECVWKDGYGILRIGLDGRWRENGGRRDGLVPSGDAEACRGAWVDDSRFVWTWKSLNDNYEVEFSCVFAGDSVRIEKKGPWDGWTRTGALKPK